MRKEVIALLSFMVGISIASIIFIAFPKQKEEIKPIIVYNENQIISNMITEFDGLSKDDWTSFSIAYYPSKRSDDTSTFFVSVDYGDVSHKEIFKTYEEFISYVSSPEKYHTRVIEVRK